MNLCEQCNAKFLLKTGLKYLLFHKNKREFKCSHKDCGKTFNSKNSLYLHKFVHSENKFKCNYCSHQKEVRITFCTILKQLIN